MRIGLGHIDSARRDLWASRIDEAELKSPADFTANNGWVVAALQGAWSATSVAALQGAWSAIAGGLLGAAYGASSVPSSWHRILNGWPGLTAGELMDLAHRIVDGGELAAEMATTESAGPPHSYRPK